jgi:tetratricopeptide (TPR) repeat protein
MRSLIIFILLLCQAVAFAYDYSFKPVVQEGYTETDGSLMGLTKEGLKLGKEAELSVFVRKNIYGKPDSDSPDLFMFVFDDSNKISKRKYKLNAIENMPSHDRKIEKLKKCYLKLIKSSDENLCVFYVGESAVYDISRIGDSAFEYHGIYFRDTEVADVSYMTLRQGESLMDIYAIVKFLDTYADVHSVSRKNVRAEGTLKLYDRLEKENKDNPDFYLERGLFSYKAEKFEDALMDFQKLEHYDKYKLFAYANKCAVYNQLNEFEKAVRECSLAIKNNADLLEAYLGRGYAYHELGEFSEAIKDYSRAIELKPDDYEIWMNRSITYENMGLISEAISDKAKAMVLLHKAVKE